jgi:hypothetical protein
MRRQLLSIVGALGLVVGLLTSAVGVQAETEPASLGSLIWTWSTSTQNVCFSNSGTATLAAGVCTINQPASSEDNVAVCAQNNTTVQSCVITQAEDVTSGEDNRALVVQHINQSGGSTQNATQSVTITQNSGLGRNDAWVLQAISQSTGDGSSEQQNNNQADTIDQVSAGGGGQSVGLGQVSWQNAESGIATFQSQTSNQDVSESEFNGHHINQTSTGLSKILVGQFQSQKLHGATGASQTQKLDPRCCSTQQSNTADTFNIFQFTTQLNDRGTGSTQNATSVAQCGTTGNCTTSSTTSQNGTTKSNSCGPSATCTAILVCDNGTCPTVVSCTGGDCQSPPSPPCFPLSGCGDSPILASVGNGAVAIAPRSRSQAKPFARSALSAALLT